MREIRLVLFLVAGLVLNLVLYKVLYALNLPFYMDTLGSIVVAVCCGLCWGIGVAVATALLMTLLFVPSFIAFLPVAIVIVFCAYFAYKRGFFGSLGKALAAGAVTGVISAALGAVIAFFLFPDGTGARVDSVIGFLSGSGFPAGWAIFVGNALVDVVDKAVQFGIVFYVLKLVPNFLTSSQASLKK